MEKQADEGDKQVQRHRQRMRAILLVIVALLLGAAGYLLFEAFWRAHLESLSKVPAEQYKHAAEVDEIGKVLDATLVAHGLG